MAHQSPIVERLTKVVSPATVSHNLKGIEVIDPTGTILGFIADFVMSQDGQIQAVIVETPGVLGIGAQLLKIKIDSLDLLVDPYDRYFLRVDYPPVNAEPDKP